VEGAKQTLEKAKQRHKARIAALRAEQRQEIEGIQAQIRGGSGPGEFRDAAAL
jgi:hypothetical protein